MRESCKLYTTDVESCVDYSVSSVDLVIKQTFCQVYASELAARPTLNLYELKPVYVPHI
jgi:hypothetical protein